MVCMRTKGTHIKTCYYINAILKTALLNLKRAKASELLMNSKIMTEEYEWNTEQSA